MKVSKYLTVLFTYSVGASSARHLGIRADEDAFVVPPSQQAEEMKDWEQNWMWAEGEVVTISWTWTQPYDEGFALNLECWDANLKDWQLQFVDTEHCESRSPAPSRLLTPLMSPNTEANIPREYTPH